MKPSKIDNVDVTTLVDANGDFNANALATVFSQGVSSFLRIS